MQTITAEGHALSIAPVDGANKLTLSIDGQAVGAIDVSFSLLADFKGEKTAAQVVLTLEHGGDRSAVMLNAPIQPLAAPPAPTKTDSAPAKA